MDVLDAIFQRKTAPRSLWDFARSMRLPADGGPHAGDAYDPEGHPAHAEILRAFENPRYSHIVSLGPVQDGKTWVTDVLPLLYAMVERCEAAAIVMPTRAKLNTLWQTKVLPAIHGNGLTHLLPVEGHGSEGATPEEIRFATGGHTHLLSTGTSNEAGLSNITVRWVFGDEVDDIQPARRLDLAWARADAWGAQARRAESSTIKHDAPGASRILRDYQAGTASRLWFRCPHCQAPQPWDWSRVTYDATNDDTARESVRLACLQGCLLTESDRRRSLLRPQLIHRDQVWADDGQVVGPAPVTPVFSLRWTALDSPLKTLGDLAQRHRRALAARDANGDHDQLRQFVRDQLATAYVADTADGEESAAKLTPAFLAARSQAHGFAPTTPLKDRHGLYSRHLAEPPALVTRSVLTIDVQGNRVYWLLVGESQDRQTFDLAWGYEFATPGQQPWTPAELHDLLDRVDGLADDLIGHTVLIDRGVDTGFSQKDLIPWLQRRPLWKPLAGVGEEVAQGLRKNRQRGIPGVIYLHQPEGWGLPGRLLHSIDVTRLRERVQNAYLVTAGKPGAAHLPRGLAVNDSYIRHLTAEELVELPSGNKAWRKTKGGGRHDYLDLRVYAQALLDLYHQRHGDTDPVARPAPPPIPQRSVGGSFLNGF